MSDLLQRVKELGELCDAALDGGSLTGADIYAFDIKFNELSHAIARELIVEPCPVREDTLAIDANDWLVIHRKDDDDKRLVTLKGPVVVDVAKLEGLCFKVLEFMHTEGFVHVAATHYFFVKDGKIEAGKLSHPQYLNEISLIGYNHGAYDASNIN